MDAVTLFHFILYFFSLFTTVEELIIIGSLTCCVCVVELYAANKST